MKLYQRLSTKLPQGSARSSAKTPHRALPKLHTGLYQSSTRSSASTMSTIMSTINQVFNGLGLAGLGLLTGLDPPAKNLSGYYPTHCDV